MRLLLILLAVLSASVASAQTFPHHSVIGVNTCMELTGTVTPLYMAAGTCVAQTEADVMQKLPVRAIFANLSCRASGDPGATITITITGRSGACTGLTSSGTFICTLTGGSGTPSCNTGSNLLEPAAGECWSLEVASSGAFSTPVGVTCTLERAM